MIYAFDLDSTLTKIETLPFVAKRLNCYDNYLKVCNGIKNLSYDEGLIRRFQVFESFSPDVIADALSEIPIYKGLQKFIKTHNTSCIITSNLECYVKKLALSFNCKIYASEYQNDITIINKRNVIEVLQEENSVCFMGDGENDVEGLKIADVAIGVAYSHKISKNVKDAADFVAYTEEEALRYLLNA